MSTEENSFHFNVSFWSFIYATWRWRANNFQSVFAHGAQIHIMGNAICYTSRSLFEFVNRTLNNVISVQNLVEPVLQAFPTTGSNVLKKHAEENRTATQFMKYSLRCSTTSLTETLLRSIAINILDMMGRCLTR